MHTTSFVVVTPTELAVTSKTVRTVWLPVFDCTYTVGNEQYNVFVNGQTRKLYGERPAVNHSRLLGALSFGLAAVLTPLAAYRLVRN